MSPTLRRWYENLKRGSVETADKYLYYLTKFCEDCGTTPDDLLAMDDASLRNVTLDYLEKLNRRGKSGSYQNCVLSALKSWLRFNGKELVIRVKVNKDTKVSKVEKVPRPEELNVVLRVAGLKERVAIALMAFGGVREEVLGNYAGTDGLRLMDFPELVVSDGVVEFTNEPTIVVVRPPLSKAGHQYFTFLCGEGMDYVLDWLKYRIRKGEKLGPTFPLIPSRKGGFMKRNSISGMIKEVLASAGFSWRPYVLRHYFDTQMLLAEAQGILPRDYRVFWMGHKGDIEHQYTTNKHRLPEDLIENMREKYRLASKFLETRTVTTVEPRQKVVSLEELDYYLEKGWEFVTVLPDNRVIVKKR